MDDIYKKLKTKYLDYQINNNKDKELIEISKENIKVEVYKDTINLVIDNKCIAHCHTNDFDTKEEIYDTIEYYLKGYKQIMKLNRLDSVKKITIIVVIFLMALAIVCAKSMKENNNTILEGRWTSTRDSLIRVIKEYKDGQPIYVNETVVEYWLDLKKDGKYALYFNDVVDQSRSDYNIEKNLLEKGKYNIDSNDKIYFDSDNKNLPSSSVSYIWTCEADNENLHNCTNYAYDFIKQKS